MSDRTRSAYDRWARTYDTDPNPQTALEFETVQAAVGNVEDADVLDAGCGTGRYAGRFLAAGARVVGIDFSAAMLAAARARHASLSLVRADLSEGLPFAADRFDRVCCAQTLKHLQSLERPMAEFRRVLKSGGILVFSVTHPDMTWDAYEMRETPAFILSDEADIHHHTMADYESAVQRAGLVLERVEAVRVSERIRDYLTADSYAAVAGRSQVAVFRACNRNHSGSI